MREGVWHFVATYILYENKGNERNGIGHVIDKEIRRKYVQWQGRERVTCTQLPHASCISGGIGFRQHTPTKYASR